jgi:hypothetical protein
LDNVDAAEMVKKEKLARQLATRLPSIARPSDCPLFEHFVVFGQSEKKSEPLKATCIYQYPEDKPVTLQALEQFVFPTGLPSDRDLSRVASSVLDYHSKTPQNAFALLLTTSIKEVFYAICLVDEFLKPYPTFIPPSDEPTHSKLTWSTRCYCIITRYPLFDLMFDVLLYLLDVEEKNLTLPPSVRSGELNQVNRILTHLWTIPPPVPGSTINLGIPKIPLYTRPARHEDAHLISSHCVPSLFWALDKETILTLVAAALLERKMIFVSSNLRLLSNCTLSFIALLKPFVLQCVFIPVLPDDLLQIAEAPVPFIAGLANPKLIRAAKEANPELIIVDLANRRVYIPPECVVPPLPNIRGLSHAIEPYVAQLRKSFDKYIPPYKAAKNQRDLVTELLRLLEQYITPYFEAFRRHCITSLTDNVTIFVKETYLIEETDHVSIEFFQPFMETQIFAAWCDNKLKEIDLQRQSKYATSSTKMPAPQRAHAPSLIVRPASTEDLASMANSDIRDDISFPYASTLQAPKGMGSPTTRPRSASVSTSTSNDEFVASLQFDFNFDSLHTSSDDSLSSAAPNDTQPNSHKKSISLSVNGSKPSSSSSDSKPLSSSNPIPRPKSTSNLAPIEED